MDSFNDPLPALNSLHQIYCTWMDTTIYPITKSIHRNVSATNNLKPIPTSPAPATTTTIRQMCALCNDGANQAPWNNRDRRARASNRPTASSKTVRQASQLRALAAWPVSETPRAARPWARPGRRGWRGDGRDGLVVLRVALLVCRSAPRV
ncbi:uncharacterized protein BKA78DRAFT_183750 [Phyllosticta capitalensis]|uniref:uncharacterized protein n=1 Tax=Phyllosticta capitalensis TaxID=121624 RepID=UPI00312FF02B